MDRNIRNIVSNIMRMKNGMRNGALNWESGVITNWRDWSNSRSEDGKRIIREEISGSMVIGF
jgi:hypothetical protein